MEAFKKASFKGDLEEFKKLLSEIGDSQLLQMRDAIGNSVLHIVSRNQQAVVQIGEVLARAPQLIDVTNDNGETALLSVLVGHWHTSWLDIALKLLKAKPSTSSIADNSGVTALHRVASLFARVNGAEQNLALELANLLLDSGAGINSENKEGETPLHHALQSFSDTHTELNFSMVEFLLNNGAELVTASFPNPLLLNLHINPVTEYLLKIKPSLVDKPSVDSKLTPLHRALDRMGMADVDLVELLLNYNASTNVKPDLLKYAVSHNCPFEIIELLLKRGKSFDINKVNNGRSVLSEYSYCYENIKKLVLEYGADATINSANSLGKATQYCRDKIFESIKFLIEAGADPAAGIGGWDKNIFVLICERCVNEYAKPFIPVLDYLCNLPQFKGKMIDTDAIMWGGSDPQFIILEGFNKMIRKEAIEIFTIIVKSKAFKPIDEVGALLNFNINQNILFEKWFLTPIGCVLNTSSMKNMLDPKTMELLDVMYEHGFNLTHIPTIPTPLTVLLACHDYPWVLDGNASSESSDETNDEEEEDDDDDSSWESCDEDDPTKWEILYLQDQQMKMARHFIAQGMNVESMSLKLFVTNDDEYDSLNNFVIQNDKMIECFKKILFDVDEKSEAEMRQEFTDIATPLIKKLWLPDALWVAFLAGNIRAVNMLLPYWSAAPLLLFVFMPRFKMSLIEIWYPVLSAFGAVPHGTEEYARLVTVLEELQEVEGGEEVLKNFEELQNSPLTLRELSKYAVRASCAERASQPGVSLPQLMLEISPPGLKQYLTMQHSNDA